MTNSQAGAVSPFARAWAGLVSISLYHTLEGRHSTEDEMKAKFYSTHKAVYLLIVIAGYDYTFKFAGRS